MRRATTSLALLYVITLNSGRGSTVGSGVSDGGIDVRESGISVGDGEISLGISVVGIILGVIGCVTGVKVGVAIVFEHAVSSQANNTSIR